MKHKMIVKFQLALCWIAILHSDTSIAKPLNPEDLEGLLPPTPRDKNETIAAIVQDPVVQDAVHQTASNGSLNGLVVKRKVYILPANNPNKVLSEREHLLVVPTENLEDVRRNITEAKRAEAESMEFSSPENQSLFEGDANQYTPEKEASLNLESDLDRTTDSLPSFYSSVSTDPLSSKLRTETEFLKDKLTNNVPSPEEDQSKKVAVPIVAVIDPTNADKGKIATSPTQVSLSPEVASNLATGNVFLAPVMVPRWEIVAPLVQDENYPRQIGDLDAAEDIIFRPLFRYRQESQERSRYRDEDINRRYRYPSYDYYGRRSPYRSRYDDY
ncbi:uncharacterized protein LOC143148471 isoform X2 [Ptiloglossa arizonensis]|uniref:uncharacterized protein LOC143148471 isoform X2 n=1 Tax=Ptiloglossa arizonensis TaxID=3350558 RepID=UPI003FA09CE2